MSHVRRGRWERAAWQKQLHRGVWWLATRQLRIRHPQGSQEPDSNCYPFRTEICLFVQKYVLSEHQHFLFQFWSFCWLSLNCPHYSLHETFHSLSVSVFFFFSISSQLFFHFCGFQSNLVLKYFGWTYNRDDALNFGKKNIFKLRFHCCSLYTWAKF